MLSSTVSDNFAGWASVRSPLRRPWPGSADLMSYYAVPAKASILVSIDACATDLEQLLSGR